MRLQAVQRHSHLVVVALILALPAAALAAPPPVDQVPPEDFWSLLWFGAGWFGLSIMVLLVLCSIAGLALIIENFLAIRRGVLMPAGLAEGVQQALADGETTAADGLCKRTPSFLAAVIQAGIQAARQGPEASAKALEDWAQHENARLHRKLEYLNLVSSVGPMLGLLGTVWGMVIAFQRVAETHGRADPGQLAGGIYQALYTTVIGLVIAIPGLTCYAILRNRLDALSAEAAQLAERAVAPLRRARMGKRLTEGGSARRLEG